MVRNLVHNIWQNRDSEWLDNIDTQATETFNDIVLAAFSEAVVYLENEMGSNPDEWEWGKIHTLTLNHPLGKVAALNMAFDLNRGPYAVGGSFHTVAPYSYSFSNLFKVNHGASHRHFQYRKLERVECAYTHRRVGHTSQSALLRPNRTICKRAIP